MATYGKKLLDVNGNVILPKTRSSLVYMDDNSTVENKINGILNSVNSNTSEINKIKDGSTVVGKALSIRDANVTDKEYNFYSTDKSSATANTSIAIWDETINGSRPVDRAVNDVNAKPIHTTYMPKGGGTFTGAIVCHSDSYTAAKNIVIYNTGFVSQNCHYCWGMYK